MNQKEYAIEWLNKAEEDFEVACYLLKAEKSYFSPVCFHLQQAAEKYLKAFLTFHNKEVIKTHSIEYLLNTCADFSDDFKQIEPNDLSDYAVDVRYPAFIFNPDLEETNRHKEIVEEIRQIVLKTLKI